MKNVKSIKFKTIKKRKHEKTKKRKNILSCTTTRQNSALKKYVVELIVRVVCFSAHM